MRFVLAGLCLALIAGCGDDDDVGDASIDAAPDASTRVVVCQDLPVEPTPMCDAVRGDYAPNADDDWAACASDDGTFHAFGASIGAIARVSAYERIAALLFDPTADPSADAFTEARAIYDEPEGLGARVGGAIDVHYEVSADIDCTMADDVASRGAYCIGASTLEPSIADAFTRGVTGEQPRTQAARIQANLLWFFYVSAYQLSLSCTDKAADCDAAASYFYGDPRTTTEQGLARAIREVDADAADAARTGFLAVQCWRDIDSEEVATMDERREQARTQYDRAVTDGLAAILRDRLVRACAASDAERDYYRIIAETLGRAILTVAETHAPDEVGPLHDAFHGDGALDAAKTIMALDGIFECP